MEKFIEISPNHRSIRIYEFQNKIFFQNADTRSAEKKQTLLWKFNELPSITSYEK